MCTSDRSNNLSGEKSGKDNFLFDELPTSFSEIYYETFVQLNCYASQKFLEILIKLENPLQTPNPSKNANYYQNRAISYSISSYLLKIAYI